MDNAKTKDKIPNAAQRFDSIRRDFVLTLSIGRGRNKEAAHDYKESLLIQ